MQNLKTSGSLGEGFRQQGIQIQTNLRCGKYKIQVLAVHFRQLQGQLILSIRTKPAKMWHRLSMTTPEQFIPIST